MIENFEHKSDSEKLRLLADWFDVKYPNDPNDEVQRDLRRIAEDIEDMEEMLIHLEKKLGRCPDCKHKMSFGRGYPYCGNCNGN